MKFGFRTGGFRNWKIEEILKELKNIGFDGAELCLESADMRPENFTKAQADQLKQFMNNIGLEIASVSYHADVESTDQRRLNTFKAIEITNWLGSDVLIINGERIREGNKASQPVGQASLLVMSGKDAQPTRKYNFLYNEKEKQWDDFAKRLKDLAASAEKHKVYIAIEPEPLLLVSDSEEMLDMIETVGSPNLKVNLDIGHAYITDPNLIDSIKELGKSIVHTHIEDIKDKVHNHLELGEGDIDFAAMHRAFKEIGYNGYYVVDLFRLGNDPAGVATRTLKALRERFLPL